MVEYDQITTTTYALSPEATSIAKDGSHEYRVWHALPETGEAMSSADLQVSLVLGLYIHFASHLLVSIFCIRYLRISCWFTEERWCIACTEEPVMRGRLVHWTVHRSRGRAKEQGRLQMIASMRQYGTGRTRRSL